MEKVIFFCPAGIAAKLIDGGKLFHRIFTCKKDATPEMIRDILTLNVVLITIDEVSMIPSNVIVMIDEKLMQICNATKIFGGKDVLLSGDFFQMKPFGTVTFNSLNVVVNTDVFY